MNRKNKHLFSLFYFELLCVFDYVHFCWVIHLLFFYIIKNSRGCHIPNNPVKKLSFLLLTKTFSQNYLDTILLLADPAHGPGESFEGKEKKYVSKKYVKTKQRITNWTNASSIYFLIQTLFFYSIFLILKHWHRYVLYACPIVCPILFFCKHLSLVFNFFFKIPSGKACLVHFLGFFHKKYSLESLMW